MKKKEKTGIMGLSQEQLNKQIRELGEKLAAARVEGFTKRVKNSRAAKLERSRMAVLQTVRRQKELAHE